ncbi:hypothetical protein BH11CYA1_BH11CYA1_03780 [soil metagenome]
MAGKPSLIVNMLQLNRAAFGNANLKFKNLSRAALATLLMTWLGGGSLAAPSTGPTAASTKVRVVSLAPSNTELLCSVGAKAQIIGVSTFCDYPKDVASITKVGTFLSANLERLARLKPDLVLLVSGQEELASKIKNHKLQTVIVDNANLTDIGKNLERIGELTGHCQEGKEAAQNFDAKLQDLARIIEKSKHKPKVFYCVWPQPLMTAGKESFTNGIITACGGINIAGDMKTSYPRFSLERLVLSNPDLIIMPFEARNQAFIKQAPWNKLQAVRENHIYYLPDQKNDMLSRPTLRVLKGMAWLGGIFHPELSAELANWSDTKTSPKTASKLVRTSRANSFNNVYVRN